MDIGAALHTGRTTIGAGGPPGSRTLDDLPSESAACSISISDEGRDGDRPWLVPWSTCAPSGAKRYEGSMRLSKTPSMASLSGGQCWGCWLVSEALPGPPTARAKVWHGIARPALSPSLPPPSGRDANSGLVALPEPPRESWRLHSLRGWSDDKTRQVSQGAS
jgi:hypothetical protein